MKNRTTILPLTVILCLAFFTLTCLILSVAKAAKKTTTSNEIPFENKIDTYNKFDTQVTSLQFMQTQPVIETPPANTLPLPLEKEKSYNNRFAMEKDIRNYYYLIAILLCICAFGLFFTLLELCNSSEMNKRRGSDLIQPLLSKNNKRETDSSLEI